MRRDLRVTFALDLRHTIGAFSALLLLLIVAAFPATAPAAPLHAVTAFSPFDGAAIGANLFGVASVEVDETSGNLFLTDHADAVDILGSEGGTPSGVASPYRITGFGFNNGELSRAITRAAVDNSATSPSKGMLYVADSGNGKVRKYVRNAGSEQYEAAGELTPVPPFGGPPQGVTVDKDGNVYVSVPYESEGNGKFGSITKFSPTGTQLARIEAVEATQLPLAMAVDSAGDLFVRVDMGGRRVFKYPANGLGELEASNFVEVPTPNGAAQGLAVDRSSNTLYITLTGDGVAEYDATSLAEKGNFGQEALTTSESPHPYGIAVNHAAGLIYVVGRGFSNSEEVVAFNLNGPPLADTGTTSPAPLSATKATLNGTVGPEGLALGECKFEYGLYNGSYSYEASLPCEGSLPADNASHPVTAQLSGLKPNTRYHYRLLVTNANGTNQSVDKEFVTEGIATTAAASALTPDGATLNGVVRPEGSSLGECKFEYGLTKAYEVTLPCSPEAGSIPADFEPHQVSAELSGLLVGTTYHYRVLASGGLGTESGGDLTFVTLGPSVNGKSFSALGETSVTLEALINPRGQATTYHFEYGSQGPCESNPCTSAPVPDAPVGGGSSDVAVSQPVKGLSIATTYHYRVIVSNSDGVGHSTEGTFTTYDVPPSFGACPNDAFRGGRPSARLPDCRAYEQASPVDKNGNHAGGQLYKVQASLSGDGITSLTKGGLPGGEGAETYPTYLFQRGATGWSTQGLLLPPSYGVDTTVLSWTPDLAYSFSLASLTGSDADDDVDHAFFVRSSATHAIQQITPYVSGADYAFAGASADRSKLFFEAAGAGVNLTGNAATGKDNLYLYEPASDELSLVGVLPGGTAPPGGSFAGPFDWWRTDGKPGSAGGALGGVGESSSAFLIQDLHAISADGSKAFFSAGNTGQVYLREGLGGESPATVQVSASQRAIPDPNGAKPAIFRAASPDGSKAFITSCQKLTDDSTAHSTAENTCERPGQGQDLYAYDTESHVLSDLTVDSDDPGGAEVKGVIGTGGEGSYVYFAANGDLDGPGPAKVGNCQRTEGFGGGLDYSGSCNLYVWHAGTSSFVARLDASGGPGNADALNWVASSVYGGATATGRVSADGQTVVFQSQHPLTGYDHEGTPEFYRYHFGDPAPTCVTCNPTGAPPAGTPTLQSIEVGLADSTRPILSRFVSASGDRIFFETPDKLASTDVNGDDGCPGVLRPSRLVHSCQDVYEWEAPGAGSCSEASSAFSEQDRGCLYLLSGGTSSEPSYFGDASASGEDVFIFTEDQLVPGDQDRLFDAYDVRVGGGLASQNQPPASPPCEREACLGGTSAPPGGTSAGSASFQGPGNPPVKRHRKKHKKHHKHKHHKHSGKQAGAKHGGRK